jgi:hypothetical protein
MQLITAPSQSINFSIEDKHGCLVKPDDDNVVSFSGNMVHIHKNDHSFYFNNIDDLSFRNKGRGVLICAGNRCSITERSLHCDGKYVLGDFSYVKTSAGTIVKVGKCSNVKAYRRNIITVGDNSTIYDCYDGIITAGKNCVALLTEGHYHHIKIPDDLTIKIEKDGNWITTTKDWCTSRNLNNEVLMYLTLKYGESITMEQLTIENQL